MKRRITMALLGLGTLIGYASGFHSLKGAHARRAAFERHVARVCADAARTPPPPAL